MNFYLILHFFTKLRKVLFYILFTFLFILLLVFFDLSYNIYVMQNKAKERNGEIVYADLRSETPIGTSWVRGIPTFSVVFAIHDTENFGHAYVRLVHKTGPTVSVVQYGYWPDAKYDSLGLFEKGIVSLFGFPGTLNDSTKNPKKEKFSLTKEGLELIVDPISKEDKRAFVATVDEKFYERAKKVIKKWENKSKLANDAYQVVSSDCVEFFAELAQAIEVEVPLRIFSITPSMYINSMIDLNRVRVCQPYTEGCMRNYTRGFPAIRV